MLKKASSFVLHLFTWEFLKTKLLDLSTLLTVTELIASKSVFQNVCRMPCCKTTNTWATNLKVGADQHKQFVVQLKRDIGCCTERYQIFVNNELREGESLSYPLSYNPCSPLCCPGGASEWDQDGHHFMLVYNSLSLTSSVGGFRLFIDGIDVNTGREFSAFWRRRGLQILFIGLCFILLGIIWSLIFRYLVKDGSRLYFVGYGLICGGVFDLVLGIIPLLKYRNPGNVQSGAVRYDANTVW